MNLSIKSFIGENLIFSSNPIHEKEYFSFSIHNEIALEQLLPGLSHGYIVFDLSIIFECLGRFEFYHCGGLCILLCQISFPFNAKFYLFHFFWKQITTWPFSCFVSTPISKFMFCFCMHSFIHGCHCENALSFHVEKYFNNPFLEQSSRFELILSFGNYWYAAHSRKSQFHQHRSISNKILKAIA